MGIDDLIFILPYALSVALSVTLAVYCLHRSHVPMALTIAVMALVESGWTLGFLLKAYAPSLETKILWDSLLWLPFLLLPFLMLVASRAFVGRPVLPLTGLDWLYLAATALAMVVILTDQQRGWLYAQARVLPAIPRGALTYPFGPFVYGMTAVVYALSLTALWRVWRHASSTTGIVRTRGRWIFAGLALPLATGLLTLAGLTVGPHRDLSPLTFGLGGAVIAWGIFRYRILDLLPVAYETAFHSMEDPIAVVDWRGLVAAHNAPFAALAGRGGTSLVGQPFEQLPLEQGQAGSQYDLKTSPVQGRQSDLGGTIFVYRNVTELREAQARQLEQERIAAIRPLADRMAHELNSPLAAILSAAAHLRQSLVNQIEQVPDDPWSQDLFARVRVPDPRSGLEMARDRLAWLSVLERAQMPDARRWADRINDAGIAPHRPQEDPEPWSDPARWTRLPRLLDTAAVLASLWVIQQGAEKSGQIVQKLQDLNRVPEGRGKLGHGQTP